MVNIKLHHFANGEVGEIKLDSHFFLEDIDVDLLYKTVKMERTNARQGTASTKTRSEVTGSNRKPWRQKGTGRARHGSRKTPLWVGGGVTFGPQPKDYNYRLPKKMKSKAKRTALSARFKEGKLKLIDTIAFEEPGTKQGIDLLNKLDFDDKVLIIISPEEENIAVKKSFSNIPHAKCLLTNGVNVYDILKHEELLITKQAFDELVERLS